jgi:hypothetical protein
MLAAIRRASSLLSNLPAERRPGSHSHNKQAQRLTIVVAHDETGVASRYSKYVVVVCGPNNTNN